MRHLNLTAAGILILMDVLLVVQAVSIPLVEYTLYGLLWLLAWPKLTLIISLIACFRIKRTAPSEEAWLDYLMIGLLLVGVFLCIGMVLQYLAFLAAPVHQPIH